jgi:glutamate--cysteine ligase
VQTQVDALLTKVRRKYKEYGINEKPFVVVKADQGGMGAGVLTVRDARRSTPTAARALARPCARATAAGGEP